MRPTRRDRFMAFWLSTALGVMTLWLLTHAAVEAASGIRVFP